eukprot:c18460_g1_i1.p1 GENE.c18460_g1_i1~~c18460_g1_i1.p1  ORF type:complete len:295 (-),score=83.96 c18460_g1_i1:24-875(-)
MTEARTQSIIKNAAEKIDQKDYYGAHELFKAMGNRFIKSKKFDEAQNLLVAGIKQLVSVGQIECASSLSILYVECFEKRESPEDTKTVDSFLDLISLFPMTTSVRQLDFIKTYLRWSQSHGSCDLGHPRVHDALALRLHFLKEYDSATYHYVRGTQQGRHVMMIVEYVQLYPGDADFLLASSVLQYLCIGNLRDANLTFKDCRNTYSAYFLETSLIKFISYLLKSLEYDSHQVFQILRKKYKNSLSRDFRLQKWLDEIAAVFYKVPIPAGGLEMLTSMFSNSS